MGSGGNKSLVNESDKIVGGSFVISLTTISLVVTSMVLPVVFLTLITKIILRKYL